MRKSIYLASVLLLTMPWTLMGANDQGPWEALFDGQTLDGWIQRGGAAQYRAEDSCIVGSTVPNTSNSFLCTPRNYADFMLEYEFKVHPELNSGVQIRSHSKTDYNNGRVHGYQVEIDPNPKNDRWWTAGIYDEARRGWLYPSKKNQAQCQAFTKQGRKIFRQNQWNRVRIQAEGSRIRTWLNGEPCADLTDGMTASGFIALQVHGVGGRTEPLEVRWRNLRMRELNIKPGLNKLTRTEKANGWKLLFDGRTSKGWRSARARTFPQKGWTIEDGALSVHASGGAESAHGGDIVTEKMYRSFILDLEFRMTPGANSGIKYFVDCDLNKGKGSSIGLEYQVLDDAKHPDAKAGVSGNRTLASLYDLIPALSAKKPEPMGQWNHARLVVQGNHIEHWLNGEKVLEFEKDTQIYWSLVAYSKYKGYGRNFAKGPKGNILLQDHGDQVSFRNIKIKELE